MFHFFGPFFYGNHTLVIQFIIAFYFPSVAPCTAISVVIFMLYVYKFEIKDAFIVNIV